MIQKRSTNSFALKKTTEAKSEKEKYKKCVETAKA